ncbi:MAG: DNA repair protein RecN [Pseudomonadota bacterium]
MLRDLAIRNFAVIENLHIQFSNGFTALSGETGAGKSIIINAIKLLLGSKPSEDMIREGEDIAEVEAFFEVNSESKAARFILEQGLSNDEDKSELLVRRVIARNNRNKNFINNRMCTLQILTSITEELVNISGQHAHYSLLRPETQLAVLDEACGLEGMRNSLQDAYHKMGPLLEEVGRLQKEAAKSLSDKTVMEFQKNEILDAHLSEEEEATLNKERLRLKNAGLLCSTLGEGIDILYSSQSSADRLLKEVGKRILSLGKIDQVLTRPAERVLAAAYEIEDCVAELSAYIAGIHFSQERLEEVEERLDVIQRLKRKYGKSISGLLELLKDIDKRIAGIATSNERIEELKSRLDKENQKICSISKKLSDERKEGSKKFCRRVEEELATLNMSGTQFDVDFDNIRGGSVASEGEYLVVDGKRINEYGFDQINFLISPNPGERPKSLSDIASGGELSRILLAIKTIVSEKKGLGTVVFDEIDSGIGSSAADGVAKKMKALSGRQQVICITHFAQIAAQADYHFVVTKNIVSGRTITQIELLNRENRLYEIARMLGGRSVSCKGLDHAKEMLGNKGSF